MITATAKAKEEKPKGNFTAAEALTAISAFRNAPSCACAIIWAAVEEFGISLTSPIKAGGHWVASEPSGPVYGLGETPLSAVEEVLRQIGEVMA